MTLTQPGGSKVGKQELRREVEEYFVAGARVLLGNTVVDVGANVGAFALIVAEKCKGDVRLLCVEPSPRTHRALHRNFREHSLLHRTRHSLHPIGLTSTQQAGREVVFYNFRRFPTNSTLDVAGKRREFEIFFEDRGQRVYDALRAYVPCVGATLGGALRTAIAALPKGPLGWWVMQRVMGLEEFRVSLDTLDQLLDANEIACVDLLKIDVEGHEVDVLRGLSAGGWAKIKQVVVETNDRDGRQREIEALLRTNGLTELRITAQAVVDNGLNSVIVLATRPGPCV